MWTYHALWGKREGDAQECLGWYDTQDKAAAGFPDFLAVAAPSQFPGMADALGVKLDGRWSDERVRKELLTAWQRQAQAT